MTRYFFSAANDADPTVYGAECPGYGESKYDHAEVSKWIIFMKQNHIKRVTCLLPDNQLKFYKGLPGSLIDYYATEFGGENVLHERVEEMRFCTPEALRRILTFLRDGTSKGQRTVIHCLAGYGRTGHVLAAWLVYNYGMSAPEAIKRIEKHGREPFEATYDVSEKRSTLFELLSKAEQWGTGGLS